MGKEGALIAPMGSFKRKEITRITWSLEELTKLVNDKNSHVHLVNTRRHIALHPCQLVNLKQSLQDVLGGDINYYDDNLEGLFLSYKNPKLLSENAAVLNETFSCHVDIEADFYVFRPKVGYVLKGLINKKAVNHLGVLVHKAFNVSIPKRDEDEEYWHGDQLYAGDEVTFTVELMDLKPGKGKLPFIRGKLVFSDDTNEISVTKISKKHRFTDEELNSGGSNCDAEDENGEISRIDEKKPQFSSTVNEDNSSESEGERVESSVKRTSQNLQVDSDSDGADDTVTGDRIKSGGETIRGASSVDSDQEAEVSNKSRRKKLSKKSSEKNKNLQQSSEDSGDEVNTTIEKLSLEKSSEKCSKKVAQDSEDSEDDPSTFYKSKNIEESSNSNEKNFNVNGKNSSKGKIQVASSDDSDADVPVFNKSMKKLSTEKTRKESMNEQASGESDVDVPIFNKSKNIEKNSSTVESKKGVSSKKYCGNGRTASSDDSNDDLPVLNSDKSIKTESPKKVQKTLKNIQQDSSDSDDNLPIFNKSIKKSLSPEKLCNELIEEVKQDSDDSDDQVLFASKTIQKSPSKKSQKSSKRIPQNSADFDDEFPISNNSIKQGSPKKLTRKLSESENSVIVDDSSKKVKKQSKKLKKVEVNESGDENLSKTTRINGEVNSDGDDNDVLHNPSKRQIISENMLNSTNKKIEVEKRSTSSRKTLQKRKGKPAHDISSSDDSETENNRKKSIKIERELKKNNSDNETNNVNDKSTKNKINDDDDSDDDFVSFMLAQKIEEENGSETSKTAKSEEESQSNDSQPVSSSKNPVSLKKKSKKASGNRDVEDDSIQMLLHAEHIKPEEESKIENVEESDLDISKKVKRGKKKSKKFKRSETLQEEDINSGISVKIKEEKKKSNVLRVQSNEIVDLQAEEDSDAEFDSSTADLRLKEAESHDLFPFMKKEKKGRREKESKSEKSKKKSEDSEIREEKSTNIPRMSPPPPRPLNAKKHKSSKIKQSFIEDNAELSDASSTKSRILVQKEESVLFANIKIKQEPYASDVESISSRKRKRKDSTRSSSERNDTFNNIRIKRESSVVSELNVKIKRDRRDSVNNSSIKSEANASDLDDAPPKKKSKKKFSE